MEDTEGAVTAAPRSPVLALESRTGLQGGSRDGSRTGKSIPTARQPGGTSRGTEKMLKDRRHQGVGETWGGVGGM